MGHLGIAALALVTSGWEVAMTGDADGDHLPDTIWYDLDTGQVTVWLMAGTHIRTQGPVFDGPEGKGWAAVNVADADGDGIGDIIWVDADRNLLQIWLMDGTRPKLEGPEIPGPGVGWTGVTTADFNGDGMTDVLYRDPVDSKMTVYFLHGVDLLSRGPIWKGPEDPEAP
jgi:hypothetical protein